MAQFTSAEDFCAWVDLFDYDDKTRPALPLLLQSEVYGFGLALACDFLKELGYLNFAKPDVHLTNLHITRIVPTNRRRLPTIKCNYSSC